MMIEDITVRLGVTDLIATSPVMRAIQAVSYLKYRDYHRGEKATDMETIRKDIFDALGPNATPFERGLALGLALAIQTEAENRA